MNEKTSLWVVDSVLKFILKKNSSNSQNVYMRRHVYLKYSMFVDERRIGLAHQNDAPTCPTKQ